MTSHSQEAVRAQLRALLVTLGTGAAFADTDDVFERGVVRSLNLIELITFVEDTYGFEITQRDVFDGHLRSVDRLVQFVAVRTERAS